MALDVFFVLPPNLLLVDLAGPADAFRIASQLGASFRSHFIAPVSGVPTSLGLSLEGASPLPEVLPDEALVVISGAAHSIEAYARPEAREIVRWLRRKVDPSRQRVASICSGSLLTAEAGLLDGRQCTTHHTLLERLQQLAPQARVQQNRVFVQDGPISSSAGITAGVDLALQLIAELAGPGLARDVARHMVVYFRRSAGDPELSPWLTHRNHLHPAVHKAQDLIAADPARAWRVEDLAGQVHVSARHLSRLFREHAGVSVHDYHTGLRLALASQWRGAGLSKEKAALAAGFSSARQLNRAGVGAC
ncbi:GlxA family transcriptional regulator [Chromobacterium haemolyticum]|uniref:GlxA family transcriptional regulator n=1 Tax=Chromobacterium haemolyticum TaxID=394935 RepID=UPI0009DAEE90|nr:helix-turn-helix domain-containing protein [Chromobacterium haemolyticum]OQS33308.1 AraC family transcriptional regulator [Chromobacterium haemolyticum]PTU68974.1 AraC family transcriptional regulator [Chromobacterium haemolyticum]